MASISARSFSVEETRRYAGGWMTLHDWLHLLQVSL